MSDTLVFDMASEAEGSPNVFVRKDWLTILDNQNGNYQGNQSIIDTSQLANSNKYINYREAYFTIPLLLTITAPISDGDPLTQVPFANEPMSKCVGLKNWYGSLIHSFTLDYNGTTIIQQTPYIGLWNSFKLMTSLSWNDVKMMGSQIGFYPDSSESVSKLTTFDGSVRDGSGAGILGTTVNNQMAIGVANVLNYSSTLAGTAPSNLLGDNPTNLGLVERSKAWNLDPYYQQGSVSPYYPSSSADTRGPDVVMQKATFFVGGGLTDTYDEFDPGNPVSGLNQLWKSYVFNKGDCTVTNQGCIQWAITAQVYLKHLHSFFERVPLLKGVFCKMTLNLNQSSVTATTVGGTGSETDPGDAEVGMWQSCSVNSPLGGVSPIMIASGEPVFVGNSAVSPVLTDTISYRWGTGANLLIWPTTYTISLAVGKRVLNTTQSSGNGVIESPLGTSIILNAPAYTFSPVFESSYLSDPIKKIVYTDVYQYQVMGIGAGSSFNNLVSNGIANIKSVLVLPFYQAGQSGVANSTAPTGNGGLLPFQSPFDAAGGGPTSPYCLLNQFNIQISGQNAIYNTERYAYEHYMNQLYGANSVNGGMTDGMSSGLVSQRDFETCYNYYYVNCSRMLPVEEAVPKSVNILGQSQSNFPIDLYIFVEYGVEIDVDVLTGARV